MKEGLGAAHLSNVLNPFFEVAIDINRRIEVNLAVGYEVDATLKQMEDVANATRISPLSFF